MPGGIFPSPFEQALSSPSQVLSSSLGTIGFSELCLCFALHIPWFLLLSSSPLSTQFFFNPLCHLASILLSSSRSMERFGRLSCRGRAGDYSTSDCFEAHHLSNPLLHMPLSYFGEQTVVAIWNTGTDSICPWSISLRMPPSDSKRRAVRMGILPYLYFKLTLRLLIKNLRTCPIGTCFRFVCGTGSFKQSISRYCASDKCLPDLKSKQRKEFDSTLRRHDKKVLHNKVSPLGLFGRNSMLLRYLRHSIVSCSYPLASQQP